MDDVIIDIPGIEFPPETEEWAITLAAFDVMKKLCEERRISKEELEFIAKSVNTKYSRLIRADVLVNMLLIIFISVKISLQT